MRLLVLLVDLDAEERRHVGDAGGLLHVVRDDDDRVLLLQLDHQILDRRGRDRVERRARLVHQDHLRLDRDAARDAEPLLLAAREAVGVVLEAVLDLVPERCREARARRARRDRPSARAPGARTRCCRRSTSGTGSASGRPCRSACAPRRGRRRGRRDPGRGRGSCPRRARSGSGRSCRSKQRMKVILPQPDGPMNAVTCVLDDVHRHVREGEELAVVDVHVVDSRRRRPRIERRRALAGAARCAGRGSFARPLRSRRPAFNHHLFW